MYSQSDIIQLRTTYVLFLTFQVCMYLCCTYSGCQRIQTDEDQREELKDTKKKFTTVVQSVVLSVVGLLHTAQCSNIVNIQSDFGNFQRNIRVLGGFFKPPIIEYITIFSRSFLLKVVFQKHFKFSARKNNRLGNSKSAKFS